MFNSFESLKCSLPASLLLNELWDKALKKKTLPFRNNMLHLFGRVVLTLFYMEWEGPSNFFNLFQDC